MENGETVPQPEELGLDSHAKHDDIHPKASEVVVGSPAPERSSEDDFGGSISHTIVEKDFKESPEADVPSSRQGEAGTVTPVPPSFEVVKGKDRDSLPPLPPRPSDTLSISSPSSAHRRSFTMSKGTNVSVVLITTALEAIASSREAKRSAPLRENTQRALELIRSNQAGDQPREIFEPLRLACETRNEKLMIASLDCISKLISYSFFEDDGTSVHALPSPPPSPQPGKGPAPIPSLVDLVAHTITSCHSETTPDAVSLQIVKALLALVLSHSILVHHSSLLKAIRTVYNIFLLSADSVNQMVAQGGLTQMVHHVFTRCRRTGKPKPPFGAIVTEHGSQSPTSFTQPLEATQNTEDTNGSDVTPASPEAAERPSSPKLTLTLCVTLTVRRVVIDFFFFLNLVRALRQRTRWTLCWKTELNLIK